VNWEPNREGRQAAHFVDKYLMRSALLPR